MTWEPIFQFEAVLAGLAGTAIAVAKFFSGQQKTLTLLRDEIKDLKTQTKVLQQPMTSRLPASDANIYQQLIALSTEARQALAADIHSVSTPVPAEAPTHLRIILSTDPESEKVVGREFPINKGFAGWVFQRQQPSFKNFAGADSQHFTLVDKAAGTQTGAGAILTLPLVAGKTCRGVIQFMKTKGGQFGETDLQVASRLVPGLTRLLGELQDSPTSDIPVVAHGDTRPITILFADISHFSQVLRQLRLHDAVDILNEYYSRLLQFALNEGGKLEEYLGDGFYVSFTHSVSSQAARQAIVAAQGMQAEYQKLLQGWKDYQHPVSDRNTHRIGLSTGVVYTGLLGHPNDRRTKLVGPAVDLAAHLCEDLKSCGGGIAICPYTEQLVHDDFRQFKPRKLDHGEAWVMQSSTVTT